LFLIIMASLDEISCHESALNEYSLKV